MGTGRGKVLSSYSCPPFPSFFFHFIQVSWIKSSDIELQYRSIHAKKESKEIEAGEKVTESENVFEKRGERSEDSLGKVTRRVKSD